MDGVINGPYVLNATLCPKENIYIKFLGTRYLKEVHYFRDCGTKGCIFIPTPLHNFPIIVRYVLIAFSFWSLSIMDEAYNPKVIRDVIVG